MKYSLSLIISLSISFGCAQKTGSITTLAKYPSLKAVLVVGHTQGLLKSSISSMDKIAAFLKEKGVKTYCFYDTLAHWNKIKEAAKGASFFIYDGHGSPGGGLNIQSGGSTSDILELQLSKNAVVCFQSVCFGAGSSAGDETEITINEAAKRVNWYADPFLKTGAGCYFANNWDDGILSFLRRFFEGETAKQCFEHHKVDTIMPQNNSNIRELGLSSNNLGGTVTVNHYINGVKTTKKIPRLKSFDVAWVGTPSFSFKDLLKK